MELESSSLYREVLAILDSSAKPVHYTLAADIHCAEETFRAMKVVELDIRADYENNYGDEVIIRVAMLAGDYAKKVYPNQSSLDITLYRYPLQEVGDALDSESAPQSERFAATLLDQGHPMLEGNAKMAATEEALNLSNFIEVEFQLVNKALEQLRLISVGGNYRNCTVEEVIKLLLTSTAQSLKVEGARLPKGVDMVPASNEEKRDHVIVRHGTRLVDLPLYLQHKVGVYNAGMGYYLHGDYWYVYPCFDTTRFTEVPRTLTVLNIPSQRLAGVERTYREDGTNLVVLATGEVRFKDDTDAQQLNYGNGVRFADARQFMDGFGHTQNNKTVVSRGRNASEFITTKRPNGNNNVPVSKAAISANPFAQYSAIARRQGSFLTFVWENSNPALIYPGMMVKVLYLLEDEIRELYGVVLRAHHYTALRGQGLTTMRYQSVSSISLFVQPHDEEQHDEA